MAPDSPMSEEVYTVEQFAERLAVVAAAAPGVRDQAGADAAGTRMTK